jgi:hypothetical protein
MYPKDQAAAGQICSEVSPFLKGGGSGPAQLGQRGGCGARGDAAEVLGHEQPVENEADIAVDRRRVSATLRPGFDWMRPTAKRRKREMFSGTLTGSDAASVFIAVPVDDVVGTVFDRPVAAIDLQRPLGARAERLLFSCEGIFSVAEKMIAANSHRA